jgi:uncharacterized protein DUF5857
MSWPFSTCGQTDYPYGINGLNPYDFTNWAYVEKSPSGPQAANLVTGNVGDPYLGMIAKKCEDSSETPTLNSIPYVLTTKDCQLTRDAIGKCPENGCNPDPGAGYGKCGLNSSHKWWLRNWPVELATADRQMLCCTLDTTTPNRTQYCPTDWYAGSPQCASAMRNNCTYSTWNTQNTYPVGAPGSYCEQYMNATTSNLATIDDGLNAFTNALYQYTYNLQGQKPLVTDPFVPYAVEWCSKYPGLCDPYLGQVCSTLTKNDLSALADSNNPQSNYLAKLCACFLPSTQYYLPGIIPTECDANCALNLGNNGVPLGQYSFSGANTARTCKQNTCVIDDLTITALNSKVGNVNVQQACPGCPSGGCSCIMNNVNVNLINSETGQILAQNCSSCPTVTNGVSTPGTCSTAARERYTPTFRHKVVSNRKVNADAWIWILIALAVLVILVWLYW